HHAQFFKDSNTFPLSSVFAPYLIQAGKMGVNLFFVLSGFLISYLLFAEKKATDTISLKKFYIRRALRIWPLYFAYGLMIICVTPLFFQLLHINITAINLKEIITDIIFLLLFAVNFQLTFFSYNKSIVEIIWSVCVEEQFYLIWPLILKKFFHKLQKVIFWLFAFGMISKVLLHVITVYFKLGQDFMMLFDYLMLPNKVELFAAGMAAAYIHFNKMNYVSLLTFLQKKPVQILLLAVTFVFILTNNFYLPVNGLRYYYFTDYVSAVLFAVIILNIVQEKSVLNLEYPVFKTLGKISFGIYLFHPPVCRVVLLFMTKVLKLQDSFIMYDIVYPLLATTVTSCMAYLSYEFFEKRFLVLKNRFAIIKTRV
ncbi:MAG: acyltransferase, partial [Bacteroidetes bacterium]|nr:acyltransferase [Bacteroidota bacterium]